MHLFPAARAEQTRLSLDELQRKYDRLKADFEQTLQNNETLKDVVQRLRQGNKNREVRKMLKFLELPFSSLCHFIMVYKSEDSFLP